MASHTSLDQPVAPLTSASLARGNSLYRGDDEVGGTYVGAPNPISRQELLAHPALYHSSPAGVEHNSQRLLCPNLRNRQTQEVSVQR
jgi:hypothetical protein